MADILRGLVYIPVSGACYSYFNKACTMDPFGDLNTIEEVEARYNEFKEAGEGRIYWHAANRRKIYLHYQEREYIHICLINLLLYACDIIDTL